MGMVQSYSRREVLRSLTGAAGCMLAGAVGQGHLRAEGGPAPRRDLAGQVGITTSSVDAHIARAGRDGKIDLLDLPRVLADEIDVRVIDFNTTTLGSAEPQHAERVRAAVDKVGAVAINIKLNQRELELGSADAALHGRSIVEYKRWIDAAAILGAAWVRPIPKPQRPVMDRLVAGYHELIEYGAPRGVGLLVENYGWMQGDADAAADLVQAIGMGVRASPDTGNWENDEVRYKGLARLFPLAASCDFKARQLGPGGEHPLYDLRRCFQAGWDAGFRGPWCLEHANSDLATLWRELALLRDMLNKWMAAAAG